MRLAAYVILLFSISVMFYFFGYPSVLVQLYENNASESQDMGAIISSMAGDFLDSDTAVVGLGLAGVLAGITLGSFLGGGFVAMYLVPMILLMLVLNFLVYPMGMVLDEALPLELRIILVMFFNLLTILAALSFIRGSV